MFFQFSTNYSKSIILLNIVLCLTTTIKRYAIPDFEYIPPGSYLLVMLERVLAIGGFVILYIISNRCRSRVLMVAIYLIIPIIVFEANALCLSYVDGYITYALFINGFREVILLNIDHRGTYLIEATNIAYHIIRAVVFKMQDRNFPVFTFLAYLLSYVFINLPLLTNFIKIRDSIIASDLLINENEVMLNTFPFPIFTFSQDTFSILKSNNEFTMLIQSLNMQNAQFMELLIHNTTLQQLIKEAQESNTFMLSINNFEYSIKYRKYVQHNVNLCIAGINDITILKQFDNLKAKEISRRMLASVVNHSLRTPINGIYYPLSIVKEKCLDHDSLEYINLAMSSLDKLIALIDDSIAFLECNDGKLKIISEEINIPEEISKLKDLFQFESKEKGIEFKVFLEFVHNYAYTDIKRINQILIILISNAFKYTFKGLIELHCKESENGISIIVSDTGIGISQAQLGHLFNAFSSIEKANTEAASGFQLSLVHKLITLLGGRISISSTVNVGTTFTIYLPISWAMSTNSISINVKESPLIHARAPVLFRTKALKSASSVFYQVPLKLFEEEECKTILIVDDNVTNIFVLQKMLSKINIKSEKAMNGKECVSKVLAKGLRGYFLILMDINMPVMNGFEATKIINQLVVDGKVSKTPIVAVTAQNETSMINDCTSIGMHKCLFKPIKFSELSSVITDLKIKSEASASIRY